MARQRVSSIAAPGRIESFAAIAGRDAELLILGSMPGVASLAARQYYAHPRNAFWPIMTRILELDPVAPYQRRLAALKSARIAVWDVLQSCTRPGSLDSSIVREGQVANDFAAFLRTHRRIGRVLFNGGGAEVAFRRQVLAAGIGADLQFARLPSTSPANASWSFERKLAAWRRAVWGRCA